jgi:hypothetical protein
MTIIKKFTHGLFSLSTDDDSCVLKALPGDVKLLSFFPITNHPVIPSSCSVSLKEGKSFGEISTNDTLFISAFLNRMDNFFFKINHAIIYAEPEFFHSMTMFTSGLLCIINQQIQYLTVQSTSNLHHLLKGGAQHEQERLSKLINQGNVLISPRLTEVELKRRLAK